MGFYNPFKSNFTRIAENTSKYYLELRNNYRDRFKDEASLLATAGVLDAHQYIFRETPQIGIPDMLDLAKQMLSSHDPSLGQDAALIKFIMELEVMLFTVDNPRLSPSDVATVVNTRGTTITKAVLKTITKYAGERRFTMDVAGLMESSEFKPVRKSLDIKE